MRLTGGLFKATARYNKASENSPLVEVTFAQHPQMEDAGYKTPNEPSACFTHVTPRLGRKPFDAMLNIARAPIF